MLLEVNRVLEGIDECDVSEGLQVLDDDLRSLFLLIHLSLVKLNKTQVLQEKHTAIALFPWLYLPLHVLLSLAIECLVNVLSMDVNPSPCHVLRVLLVLSFQNVLLYVAINLCQKF